MGSVENSPIAIAIAQIIALIFSAVLYARQKSALDIEKRDRGAFGKDVSQALSLATDAKHDVKTIELEHYKKLAALFSICSTELELAKTQIRSLEESVASLSNKLASRERADRNAAKAAAVAAPAEGEGDLGAPALPPGFPAKPTMADLINAGLAVPMAPVSAPAQQPASTFGKVVR